VQAKPAVVNGFDTTLLSGLAGMLKERSDGGRVTFLSKTSWQDGARCFTRYKGYRIDGETRHHEERRFVLLSDEPTELSGTDAAPGPVEALMYATGSCIAATVAANAALRGVKLTRLEVALESDLDLHGFFALDEGVRPGLGELRARITLAGDADPDTLREIARLGYQYSPVRDSVENGVTMEPEIVVTTQPSS